MRKYIVIRDLKISDTVIVKRSLIETDADGISYIFVFPGYEKLQSAILNESDVRVHLLALEPEMFLTAFHSLGYISWLNEKKSDIDEQGQPLYHSLKRTPETMIMYLMDLGVSSDQITRFMYGPGNKYNEYLYAVQEFGKIL